MDIDDEGPRDHYVNVDQLGNIMCQCCCIWTLFPMILFFFYLFYLMAEGESSDETLFQAFIYFVCYAGGLSVIVFLILVGARFYNKIVDWCFKARRWHQRRANYIPIPEQGVVV